MTTDHRAEGAVQALEDTADEVGRVREAIRLAQGVISPPHIAMILAGYDQAEGVIREQAAKLRGADHDRPRPPAPSPPGRTPDMTINHRAEAERLLIDADEWGKQAEEPTPEAGELSCLAFAAVHALLAIHDTLAALKPKPVAYPWPSTLPGVDAADRYAANEARQRAEASLSVTPSTDATVSDSEPDPLDEDDHRDRVDSDGDIWVRNPSGCWHPSGFKCSGCRWSLSSLSDAYGPLTFAPEPLLCGECGHEIDSHPHGDDYEGYCECDWRPSDIARKLIEQAVEQAGGRRG